MTMDSPAIGGLPLNAQANSCLPATYKKRGGKQSFSALFTELLQFVINITMRTVSQVVDDIIRHSPFLAEMMADDLANNAKIARKIKPEVEKRLLERVSEQSKYGASSTLYNRAPA